MIIISDSRNSTKRGTLLVTCLIAMVGTTVGQNSSVGTELGQGVVTRTDVERYADIALDIRDFRTLLAEGDSDGAMALYKEGRNVVIDAERNTLFTLQQMSTGLQKLKTEVRTPAYKYHLYGLADRDVTPSNLDQHASYADVFIRPLIGQSHRLQLMPSWPYTAGCTQRTSSITDLELASYAVRQTSQKCLQSVVVAWMNSLPLGLVMIKRRHRNMGIVFMISPSKLVSSSVKSGLVTMKHLPTQILISSIKKVLSLLRFQMHVRKKIATTRYKLFGW
ncbi:hypothetical protein MHU86_14061 [Fragilaria crotonensis]|nr:hypothetical protein MHU86_14061 [Fragilaria crotonensis]